MLHAAEGPPERKPSLLLPSGVQTVKVFFKGDDMQLECIPAGLYVCTLCHQCHTYIVTSL